MMVLLMAALKHVSWEQYSDHLIDNAATQSDKAASYSPRVLHQRD